MAGSMSGSMYANTSTNAYRFILYWTITNQGISGSTAYSDVTFTFKGRRLNTSYDSYNGNSSYSFSIDGTTNASGSLNFDSRSWANNGTEYTLWSSPVAVRINHSSAGSKTAALSFTLSLGSSTLTISNSTGPTQTFTIGQYQSAYNYKVEWKIGSTLVATTTIPANNTTTRSQVLGASTWGPKMTSTSSTTVTAILYTYSGNTQIGSTSSATFTLKYTIAPTLSSASASMSTSCRSYTQNLRSYYYKGQSAVVITANSFSGSNGSTLSSYTFYMNGSAVSTQTTTSWTSGTLNTVGTVSFTVRATDTRGNYVEKSTSISVIDYSAPRMTAYNAYRVSSGSTADASGTKIYYTATSAATGTGNSITAMSVATTPTASSSTASVTTNTMSGTLNGAFAITTAYIVTFTATDKMGYSNTATVPIPTASRVINVNEAKTGIGFGTFAEANTLKTSWPILTTSYFCSDSKANQAAYGRVRIVPKYTYTSLGLSSGTNLAFFSAWMKKVCEVYPSVTFTTFIGSVSPDSQGTIVWHVYDTSDVDGTTGLPNYSSGVYIPISNDYVIRFNTYTYVAAMSQAYYLNTTTQSISGDKLFSDDIYVGSSSTNSERFVKVSTTGGNIYLDATTANRGLWASVGTTGKWIVQVPANSNDALFVGSFSGRFRAEDTRSTNSAPSYYQGLGMGEYLEFKQSSAIGLASTGVYAVVETIVPWADSSGGYPTQIAIYEGKVWSRRATNASTWGAWSLFGGGCVTLHSGTIDNNALTLSNAYMYNALVFLGKPSGGSYSSMTIPRTALSTTEYQYELAANSGYRTFKIKYSGNDVIVTGVGSYNNGSITNIYGLA